MLLGKPIEELGLFTDFYQLTMAQAAWDEAKRTNTPQTQSCFELYFRKNPFEGGYAISCGLKDAIDLIQRFKFSKENVQFLREQCDSEGAPLFKEDFLNYLENEFEFTCDIDAMPDGSVVFANEPVVRITGPTMQGQLLETALIHLFGFQTLTATNASHLATVANGKPIVEFGARRAQNPVDASYAAYVGGAKGTSNAMAGFLYRIPVIGTFAHSWVMSHNNELEAFREYAASMPGNCTFLVDTYNTLEGVKKAITIGQELRHEGHEMIGIRLDSGDLAYLSSEARKLLNESGFENAKIIASNDLNSRTIRDIESQEGSSIDIYGVGTRLVTNDGQPSLGMVCKVTAVQNANTHAWEGKVKLSEDAGKITTPGRKQVRRFEANGRYIGDVLYNIDTPPHEWNMVDPSNQTVIHEFSQMMDEDDSITFEDMLKPVFRHGELVYEHAEENVTAAKTRAEAQKAHVDPRTKRILNPQLYPAGLEDALSEQKINMIRGINAQSKREIRKRERHERGEYGNKKLRMFTTEDSEATANNEEHGAQLGS